jgi:hypothetical protein
MTTRNLFLALLLLTTSVAYAQSTQPPTAMVSWVLPITRIDGSPLSLSNIASVQLYDGSNMVSFCTPFCTSIQSGPLNAGVHNFYVIVTDTLGSSSPASSTSSITLYNLTVTVNDPLAGTASVSPGAGGITGTTIPGPRIKVTGKSRQDPSYATKVVAVLN